jgi:hypothetical protein
MSDQADERRHPNFVFFDGNGDEVGGMMFREIDGAGGRSIARFLTFDGYEHQETVVLGVSSEEKYRRVGPCCLLAGHGTIRTRVSRIYSERSSAESRMSITRTVASHPTP